jgi:NADH dehydrogenase
MPLLARALGLVLHDVLLTTEEFRAMAAGLADTEGPATGSTKLSEWLAGQGETFGLRYANEIERHFDIGAARP